MEPWLAGNARGPSTAFCLLYRLFELKPSEEEVQATINHEDSVYIRAVSLSSSSVSASVCAGCTRPGTALAQSMLRLLRSLQMLLMWTEAHRHVFIRTTCLRRSTPPAAAAFVLRASWAQLDACVSFMSLCHCIPAWCCALPRRWASCTCAMWQTPGSCGAGWGLTVTTKRCDQGWTHCTW